nr:RNA-directed DNA polymerase, eukaryota [Tanacetum cinerariifolium]
MWDVSLFKKHKVLDGDEGFISILGEWLNVGTDFLMVVVYAPQDASKKRILCTRLRDLNIYFQVMTIVLGDFNELLDVELSPIVHRSWFSSHVTSGHQLLVTTRQFF